MTVAPAALYAGNAVCGRLRIMSGLLAMAAVVAGGQAVGNEADIAYSVCRHVVLELSTVGSGGG